MTSKKIDTVISTYAMIFGMATYKNTTKSKYAQIFDMPTQENKDILNSKCAHSFNIYLDLHLPSIFTQTFCELTKLQYVFTSMKGKS